MEGYQDWIQHLVGEWPRGDLRIANNRPLSELKVAERRGFCQAF